MSRVYVVPASRSSRRREDWAESENPWLYGGLTRVLRIDDHVSITSVEVDTGAGYVLLDPSEYELLERNAPTLPEPEPYNKIALLNGGFTPGAKVRVTGVGGWPQVPAAIKTATVLLLGMVTLRSPYATNVVTELDTNEVIAPQARAVVNGLYRYYLNPAVYV